MAFDGSCGSSLFLCGHLSVVIFELGNSPEEVVLVNLTTKRANSDITVVLQPGDHKFVKHETVISYSDTRIVSKSDLVRRVEDKYFEQRDDFSEDILRIIQQGLLSSPFTPNYIKEQCQELMD